MKNQMFKMYFCSQVTKLSTFYLTVSGIKFEIERTVITSQN